MKHIQKLEKGFCGSPVFEFGRIELMGEGLMRRLDNFTRKVEHDAAEGRDPTKSWDYLRIRARSITGKDKPFLDRVSAIIASVESEMLWEQSFKGWRQTNLGRAVEERLATVIADRTEDVGLRTIAHQAMVLLRIPPA